MGRHHRGRALHVRSLPSTIPTQVLEQVLRWYPTQVGLFVSVRCGNSAVALPASLNTVDDESDEND